MSIFENAKKTDYYTWKDGALYRNVAAGQFFDRKRPTRNAGKFKIFVDSFPNAALPYSVYLIANTETGEVFTMEVLHQTSFNRLNDLVEELKQL